MFYFVNGTIVELNAGIEHAEFNRIKLFKQAGVPAKILTRYWNRNLYANIANEKQDPDDFLNMWDVLQSAENIQRKEVRVDDLNIPTEYIWDRQNDFTDIWDGDQHIMHIQFRGGLVGIVDYVQYLDQFGNTDRIDYYDWRGFKSLTQFYDRLDQLSVEEYYTPEGQRVAEMYYKPDGKDALVQTLIQIDNWNGKTLVFENLDELFAWFLDEINQRDGGNDSFISDQRWDFDTALVNMKTKAHRYAWFHSQHMLDPYDQVNSEFNNAYDTPLISHRDDFDGIIVMTEQQKKDIITRFGYPADKLFVISPTFVDQELLDLPRIPYLARQKHSVIAVARRSPEKNVDEIIKAFSMVHQKITDATLDVYGYGPKETIDELNELVSSLSLEQAVTFHNYTVDLDAVYNRAAVSVLASKMEGFGMALVESEAHGVPIVSYDTNYGPREVIHDGQNGYIVPVLDTAALAERISQVLTASPEAWQQLSDNAYIAADTEYSSSAVWQKWQPLIQAQSK